MLVHAFQSGKDAGAIELEGIPLQSCIIILIELGRTSPVRVSNLIGARYELRDSQVDR